MADFYAPGTIDLSRPCGVQELLDLHHGIFGGYTMTAGPDENTNTQDPGTNNQEPVVNEHGFPDKTPVKDMSDAQQAAYWRHQSRKHEDRVKSMGDYDTLKAERDELKAKHQTADEKALEAARKEASESAAAAERAKLAPRLVAAEFKSANAGRIPAETLSGLLDGLDPAKFLTSDGEVDADKVQQYVDGIAPADGKKWPDMGQGKRQQQKAAGVEAGRALFDARHAKK